MTETTHPKLRSVLACNIGVCMEGFDFIAYSYFSFVIARTFFPAGDNVSALLLGFATFGLAYVVRPLGGIFWGVYADKVGRRPALVIISLLMAVSVAVIAFTPSYAAIGVAAPVLIVLARLLQGFSAGGEFASATSMLVEYAPAHRRGLYAATQMVSQVLTVAVVALVLILMMTYMAPGAMMSWGWRAVFAFGILVGPVGFYMRAKMAESPAFTRYASRQETRRMPLVDVFRDYPRQALVIAGLVAVGAGSFYLVLIFTPIYSARALKVPMADAQIAAVVGCLVQIPVALFAAWLSDRVGRRAVLAPAAIVYAIVCYPLFAYLIGQPSFGSLVVVEIVGNVLLGFISGPMPAAMSELLPAEVRASGIGIVYNVVGAIFGGLGPFLITLFIAETGDKASPAYWALITGVIGAVAAFSLRTQTAEAAGGEQTPLRVATPAP
jgi:MHS family proline/betaine transporter-like MFS transporter